MAETSIVILAGGQATRFPGKLERETDGTQFRLLGVGVSAIVTADEADPADLVDGRAALAEYAVDNLRARFGDAVLVRGLGFEPVEK